MDPEFDPVLMKRIDDSKELMTQIRECLKFHDGKGLKTYVLEHKLSDQSVFWELTSELTNYITSEIHEEHFGFFEACERCLAYLVRNGNPKEMLLALLEQADSFNDDVKFKTLLVLVQKTLLQLPTKRFHSLDITLETISAHIQELKTPTEHSLEGDEKKLMDADEDVQRIGDVVKAYLDFLKPFVEEVSIVGKTTAKQKNTHQIVTLKKHLVNLLNHPLVYLDLTYSAEEGRSKSTSRNVAETAIDLLVLVETNFHKFMMEAYCRKSLPLEVNTYEDKDEMELENEENKRKLENGQGDDSKTKYKDTVDNWKYQRNVPDLALSCLAYLIHVEHLGIDKLPFIYSHLYVLEFNLPFISLLLKRSESLLNFKGIYLLQTLVQRIADESIPVDTLDNDFYNKVLNDVINIMIRCPIKELRQSATFLLPAFIKKYCAKGQYQIFQTLLSSCDHSGVQGYLIQILKDKVAANLKKDVPDKLFVGCHLEKVLKLATILPDGAATDLLDKSDRIISVLNLLRFLVLRDKPSKNDTGIWTWFGKFEKEFLDPLRTGLGMSKVHYQMEMKQLKVDKIPAPGQDGVEFNVTVAGQSISSMPKEQQIQVIEMALNTFDMIDSLLSRLLEVKDQQKSLAKTLSS